MIKTNSSDESAANGKAVADTAEKNLIVDKFKRSPRSLHPVRIRLLLTFLAVRQTLFPGQHAMKPISTRQHCPIVVKAAQAIETVCNRPIEAACRK